MTTVGGWQLVRKLASGGMGTVWKATRPTGVGVPLVGALKLPLAHVAADERETRRFLDEARMLTVLDHPNLVRVIDAGVDSGVPYMVMQWVNGIDLLNLRKAMQANNMRFSIATSLLVTARILAALDHAYSREVAGRRLGIVHRDVKPANVLISVEGHVMLTDFGVASMIGGEATGNAHGTPRYMSPEQFRGRSSHQSDIWGAGTVLWEMLAGAAFRSDLSTQEVIEHLVTETAVKPPPLRDDFTIPLLNLLHQRLLAVVPDRRFENAAVALAAVESCEGFDARATTELSGLVRRLRPAESSGYTELLLKALPDDDAEHPEIGIIYSAASGRHAALPPMTPMGLDVEDAPTDKRTPSSRVAAALPAASLSDEPSNPTMRRDLPATETIVKTVHPEPEPDAPTMLRRPRRRRVELVVPPPQGVDLKDIAGIIDTPVQVTRPDTVPPPADTDRLPNHSPPPSRPSLVRQPTDVLSPEVVATILASSSTVQGSSPPRTPSPPWSPPVTWPSRPPQPSPTDPSIPFDPFVVPPLFGPFQKRFILWMLIAFLSIAAVALFAWNL